LWYQEVFWLTWKSGEEEAIHELRNCGEDFW
jgi:hypothetical protein